MNSNSIGKGLICFTAAFGISVGIWSLFMDDGPIPEVTQPEIETRAEKSEKNPRFGNGLLKCKPEFEVLDDLRSFEKAKPLLLGNGNNTAVGKPDKLRALKNDEISKVKKDTLKELERLEKQLEIAKQKLPIEIDDLQYRENCEQ